MTDTYSIQEITTISDRYKLFLLHCKPSELAEVIEFLQEQKIPVLNIGLESASFIESLSDTKYLNIELHDHTRKILERNKVKLNGKGNDVIAIYNVGILLEPALEMNPKLLFKEFSKSTALIIIWEYQLEIPGKLVWPTQQQTYFFDFSDTQIKKLKYEI